MMPSVGDISGGAGGLGATFGLVGLAGQLWAGSKESSIAKDESAVSQQISGYEEQMNQQRQQQMTLFNQRQQVENLRNTQRAQSMGMAAAVGSGAQFGSGIAGAQGAESAQQGQNQRNLSQNLQIGNNIFGLTDQISQGRQRLSGLEGNMATYQGYGAMFGGLGGLGGGMLGGSQSLGHLFGNG